MLSAPLFRVGDIVTLDCAQKNQYVIDQVAAGDSVHTYAISEWECGLFWSYSDFVEGIRVGKYIPYDRRYLLI